MPEHSYAAENMDFQNLIALGFSEGEVTRLVHMRDHVTEQIEYREIIEESRRLHFIRWLLDHNRISR